MLFLTRWFGVTDCDAERYLAAEQAYAEEIADKVLLASDSCDQTASPARLGRGTHAKGVAPRAQFEVFDVTVGRDGA
jgi:hypothetical protein